MAITLKQLNSINLYEWLETKPGEDAMAAYFSDHVAGNYECMWLTLTDPIAAKHNQETWLMASYKEHLESYGPFEHDAACESDIINQDNRAAIISDMHSIASGGLT